MFSKILNQNCLDLRNWKLVDSLLQSSEQTAIINDLKLEVRWKWWDERGEKRLPDEMRWEEEAAERKGRGRKRGKEWYGRCREETP